MANAGVPNVPTAVVLEDTDSVFKSLDGKIRRISSGIGLNVHVHHLRSRGAFADKVAKLKDAGTRTLLIFCDIENRQGESVQALRQYMADIWTTPPNTWIGERPVIVFSRNDDTYKHMKRTADHSHRAPPSAVILQTPTPGQDPMEQLRHALTVAIRAL